MDIHKPKPWHGLREFLKEYAIIVVGVLTALAAEQAVETMHWRHELAEARETLNAEIAGNLTGVIRRRDVAACMTSRLDDLRRWLAARAVGDRSPPPAPIGHPFLPRMRSNAWESAKADQVIGHMSGPERRAYTRVYDGLAIFEDRTRETFDDWATLGLVDDAALLDASGWARITEARMREVFVNRALNGNIDSLIGEAKALAPNPPKDTGQQPSVLCRPWYPGAPPKGA